MRVIPVIDLMRGEVVRGMGGRRDEYRPIVSPLCESATPRDVAAALFTTFGLPEMYVADLDAIAGGAPDFQSYAQVAAAGPRLLIDAGIATAARADALCDFAHRSSCVAGIIAGLESVDSPTRLCELLTVVGSHKLIFSLDLKAGVPLTLAAAWRDLAPFEIARTAYACGVRRMIVLDLADVGAGRGTGTLAICRALRDADAECELIAGGGVRDADDLDALARAGCDAALVASALHDGRLSAALIHGRNGRSLDGAKKESDSHAD